MTLLEQILLTIVTASATAILAYFGFWRQAKAELQKEYETRFNEKKWETYIKFTKQIPVGNILNERHYFSGLETPAELDDYYIKIINEFGTALEEIEAEILLISSPKVVECFLKWRDIAGTTHPKDPEMATVLINVINAMREDLGKDKYPLSLSIFSGYYYLDNQANQSK